MAKTPRNNNKPWTAADIKELKQLVKGNTPTGLTAYELERTKGAIYNKASELDLSLHPTNKSPYNRQKEK